MSTKTTPGASRPRSAGRISGLALGGLVALLLAPVAALSRLTAAVDWRVLVGVPLAVSLATFLAYRSDKRRAEAGVARIPEAGLHLGALLGGWPGAFLAQRIHRHKTAKRSFQVVFWAIVLTYQFAAVDALLGWRLTREAGRWLRTAAT